MESLQSLNYRKNQLEKQLENITIKKHGSAPWAPGVLDQHKSESYSYDEYLDVEKAQKLKSEIAYLDNQIKTYAQRAQAEREREQAIIDSQIPKYEYTAGGQKDITTNPAMAARYDAQQRFFKKNKLEQTLLRATGQYNKFVRLYNKAVSANANTQEQVAQELNRMFR